MLGLITVVVFGLITFWLNSVAVTFAGPVRPVNVMRFPTGLAALLALLGALLGGALWTWCELAISRRVSTHDDRDR